MKTWFKMKLIPQANASSHAEIHIFDEIGFFGIDAKGFKDELDKLNLSDVSNVKLLLNSPGGSVFDGVAIYNMLSDYRDKLTVEVEGVAASIASIIALAGNKG